MSNDAMNWAYDQEAGSTLNKAVLVRLGNQANRAGQCWPSVEHLAATIEASRRSVIRSINELQRRGLVARCRRAGRAGDGRATTYQLPLERIREHAKKGDTLSPIDNEIGDTQSKIGDSLSKIGDTLSPQHYRTVKNTLSVGTAERFSEWFATYPRQAGEKEARKIWRENNLDQLADQLIDDTRKRKQCHRPWLEGYAPNPGKYLEGERWRDDLEAPGNGSARDLPALDAELEPWAIQRGLRGARPGEGYPEYRRALEAAVNQEAAA